MKSEYVQKAKQTILNRVRFHAPVCFNDRMNLEVLETHGVDAQKPIFKFDKPLNRKLAKAFVLAKREEDFNLVLSDENAKGCRIKDVVTYSSSSSLAFMEMINKLNINYSSNSNYNIQFNDKFFKVGELILNPHFDDFSLKQVCVTQDVFVQYFEFLLNGTNFFVKFQNKSQEEKKLCVELNIPLRKGYYYFKKMAKCVLIENLLTKEKQYLNFICKNAKFSFSNVDGLENSVYCCINVKIQLTLKDEAFVFFNLGEGKVNLSAQGDVEKFRELARKKCCEIFDVQVKTKSPRFDIFFNRVLPQKIWLNWLNNQPDQALEEKYLTLRRLFVRGHKEISLVNFKEIGVKEIGIFNGEYYKKILIILGGEKFLRVGRTFFYNINGITNHTLKSKDPVSVCFGD